MIPPGLVRTPSLVYTIATTRAIELSTTSPDVPRGVGDKVEHRLVCRVGSVGAGRRRERLDGLALRLAQQPERVDRELLPLIGARQLLADVAEEALQA
jgi:hypothetical protein